MTTHTVFTALIGNYEDLKTPTVITPNWRYICFTDQVITSTVWEIKQLNVHLEPQRMARYVKINFHKFVGSEFSLWLDASFRIDCNLQEFWDKHFKAPISAPAHPQRDSIYQEISSCIYNRRGDPDILAKQRDHYLKLGVEPHKGIITSGVLMRKKNDWTIELCEKWWEELSQWSTRDQISFAKVTEGYKINMFRWDYSNNRDLKYFHHYKYRH